VGPCHHGKARPRVADGGDGLKLGRVAANIVNKQSQTADKGRYPSFSVRGGANYSSQQKITSIRNVT